MARIPKTTKAKGERPASEVTKPINPRHQIVADAILEGHTESDAMRAAGYHPASAHQVMRKEEVQDYLKQAREEVEVLTTIKRLDVLNIFIEAIDMARTMADPANMINGADKIAKMMGYYAPETKRIELSGDQAVLSSKLKQLSDADLFDLAMGRTKLIEGEVMQ